MLQLVQRLIEIGVYRPLRAHPLAAAATATTGGGGGADHGAAGSGDSKQQELLVASKGQGPGGAVKVRLMKDRFQACC